jgi:hypothetical protein
MRTVVLVAPHFVPSFLPSVHRARLWSYYLPEFGWKPLILTTDPRYYECQTASEMLDLVPDGLEVVRTRAFPTKPVRIIGDIGLRSFPFYYSALARMATQRRFDFLHITIPANYAALLGPLVYRRFGIPYGIDYIDPWIPESRQNGGLLSKAWFSLQLARMMEPHAVRNARLITGINTSYFESVLRRNPHLRQRAEVAGMPYGGSELDQEALVRHPRKTFLFDPEDGLLHLIYAGALLPKAFDVLDRLLAAIVRLCTADPQWSRRLRIHFVGTGLFENESTRGHTVKPYIIKHSLAHIVTEMPSRIPYLDVLNHLAHASAILVLGSTESFYSPSKLYQSVMSRRPVFALLHEQSTAVRTMLKSGAGELFTFTSNHLPEPDELAKAFGSFLKKITHLPTNVNWDVFKNVSARESTRVLASALDLAWQREFGPPS